MSEIKLEIFKFETNDNNWFVSTKNHLGEYVCLGIIHDPKIFEMYKEYLFKMHQAQLVGEEE